MARNNKRETCLKKAPQNDGKNNEKTPGKRRESLEIYMRLC